MVQGEMTTPSANYIETKTKETCKALTFRLYSNGVSALFFGDYSVLNSIYIEYALKSIDACNRLIGKKTKQFSDKTNKWIYFVCHLSLLVFQHGRDYPLFISHLMDSAFKKILTAIEYYVAPFMREYKNIGTATMAGLDIAHFEVILECGEVVAITLNTNISISKDSRDKLTEFTIALHNVCTYRFTNLHTMYIGDKSNYFSLYHTTLLHGLFELNYMNNNSYYYQIVN